LTIERKQGKHVAAKTQNKHSEQISPLAEFCVCCIHFLMLLMLE
jgi:hypothetical protein